MKLLKTVLVFFIVGLILIPIVFAEDFRDDSIRMEIREFQDIRGIHIGKASTLKFMISQEGQFDSNIFLTAGNKKSDFISVTSPKFLLDVPFGAEERHVIQLMYSADIGSFSDFKSQNYVNQDVRAKVNLHMPFGYFSIQNDFKDTIERAATEFTDRVRRNEDLSQAFLGVELNKVSYEAGLSHFLKNYHDDQFHNLNYTEDFYSATGFYQILPKIKALLEYDHGVLDYPNDSTRDGDYNQVLTGFIRDLTGKTTATLKIGYQKRTYDTEGHMGFEGLVSNAEINTALSERTTLGFNFTSTAVESIDSVNNYYDMNSFSANLTQKLIGDFSLLFSTQYERRNYPEVDSTFNVKRRDSVFTENASLQYNFKDRIKMNLGYKYTEDISNLDLQDYNDNLVFLRFDFLI